MTDLKLYENLPTELLPAQGEFTCFPNLLPELQIIIWKIVAYQPRNVVIVVRALGVGSLYEDFYQGHKYVGFNPIPALLHTTRQSRLEGLKYFELAFSSTHRFEDGPTIDIPARIYVN